MDLGIITKYINAGNYLELISLPPAILDKTGDGAGNCFVTFLTRAFTMHGKFYSYN